MTKFIESFATHQLLPPWVSQGARTWGFVVRITEDCVRSYLDRYFNGGGEDRAPFDYSPLPGPQFGMVGVALHPNISSRFPGRPAGWDMLSQTEVYWTYPVLRRAITKGNLLVDPRIVWVEPFEFSDNASAVFSSREIWGTDIEYATVVRELASDPNQLHVDVAIDAIKKFSPRSNSQLLACMHIRTGGLSQVGLADLLKGNPDLEGLAGILSASGVFAGQGPPAPVKSGAPTGVELNNLKQFRDCENMAQAIYRAIVASRSSHTDIDNIVIYDAAKVEVDFMWSDSIGEMLTTVLGVEALLVDGKRPTAKGAPTGHGGREASDDPHAIDWELQRVPIKVELAFAFSSNVEFEVLSTLHTYAG